MRFEACVVTSLLAASTSAHRHRQLRQVYGSDDNGSSDWNSTSTDDDSSPPSYGSPYATSTAAATYVTVSTAVSQPPAYSYAPASGTGGSASCSDSVSPQPHGATTYKASGTGASATLSAPVSAVTNGTCGGQTLNVHQASLDWWATQTYTYVASTIDVLYDSEGKSTGWTVEPNATPFDVSQAVLEPTCTSKLTYVSELSTSLFSVSCFVTPAPTAALTSVLTQTAYKPFTETAGTGALPSVGITAPPAMATVAGAAGNYSAGTPFVFFSAYDIVSKFPTTYGNGSTGCAEATKTYTMDTPFSFEYEGEDVDGQKVVNAGVTGDVNPAFLGIVNVTAAAAGSWVAEPTVVVVMSKVVGGQAVLNPEKTAETLDLPTPTLPAGVVPIKSTPSNGVVIPQSLSNRIEQTAGALQLPGGGSNSAPSTTTAEEMTTPTQASNGGSDTGSGNQGADLGPTTLLPFVANDANGHEITLQISAPVGETVVTASYNGAEVTATALSIVNPAAAAAETAAAGAGAVGGLGGLVGLLGAIGSAVNGPTTPTNALAVLTQALQPTAAVIPGPGEVACYVVGGSVIMPGGSPVTVGNDVISVAADRHAVVIDGTTSPLAPAMAVPTSYTVNGHEITMTPSAIAASATAASAYDSITGSSSVASASVSESAPASSSNSASASSPSSSTSTTQNSASTLGAQGAAMMVALSTLFLAVWL